MDVPRPGTMDSVAADVGGVRGALASYRIGFLGLGAYTIAADALHERHGPQVYNGQRPTFNSTTQLDRHGNPPRGPRKERTMPTTRSLTLSIALLLLVVGAANAGEREGRIACTRDVLQLCRSDIPRPGRDHEVHGRQARPAQPRLCGRLRRRDARAPGRGPLMAPDDPRPNSRDPITSNEPRDLDARLTLTALQNEIISPTSSKAFAKVYVADHLWCARLVRPASLSARR